MSKLIDMTGWKMSEHGVQGSKLTVIDRGPNKNNRSAWNCKCDCGNNILVTSDNLRGGRVKSCGCMISENARKNGKQSRYTQTIDETGNKYGLLTVISLCDEEHSYRGARWHCLCDCGKAAVVRGIDLRAGKVKSCGCLLSWKEKEIEKILNNNNINYKKQFTFSDLFINKNHPLRFDFAIFNNDSLIGLIEYNGTQHYLKEPSNYYTEERIIQMNKSDNLKVNYCNNHNLPLLVLNKDNYSKDTILKWYKEVLKCQ